MDNVSGNTDNSLIVENVYKELGINPDLFKIVINQDSSEMTLSNSACYINIKTDFIVPNYTDNPLPLPGPSVACETTEFLLSASVQEKISKLVANNDFNAMAEFLCDIF